MQNYTVENKSILDRIIYLSGEISDKSIPDVCKAILDINEFDNRNANRYRNYTLVPIQLYIGSFGGSVYDMWALIDIIESSSTPIITYCSGYCMSAAAMIFLSGHIRIMHKNSYLMLHQMSCGDDGKINDLNVELEHMNILHKRFMKYLKKHTKLSKKKLQKVDTMKENLYLTANECLKFGCCDDIIEKSQAIKTVRDNYKKAKDEEELEVIEE